MPDVYDNRQFSALLPYSVVPTFRCLLQDTLYFLVVSQLFCLFCIFKHHNLQIQIINVVPDTFWHVIPFHIIIFFLDMIWYFLARNTCVSIESHSVNQWIPMSVSHLGTSGTSWQLTACDLQKLLFLMPSHLVLS